jgi:DNA-binding response OmpR family regulator
MKMLAQSIHQPTLLLIEDDELILDAMTRLFVREGLLVLTARTGHDAWGTLRTEKVDVAILDIGLPDVRGTDFCARMRQLFPNLPVIVCTGAASQEEIDQLRLLSIAYFLYKPTPVNELVAAVRSILEDAAVSSPAT